MRRILGISFDRPCSLVDHVFVDDVDGSLQFNHRAHHVQRIALAMIGIGNDWQTADTTNTRGLFDKFAKGDQREVRGGQNL